MRFIASLPDSSLQLIITHITARNANVRELLAAQGLVLQQPGADWQEDAGGERAWAFVASAAASACMHPVFTASAFRSHKHQCPLPWGLALSMLSSPLPHHPSRSPPPAPVCAWFPTMDAGCQHCEERFLAVAVAHGLCPPPAPAMTLAQVGEQQGGRREEG